MPKRSQVGTNMGSKIDAKFEKRFLRIRVHLAAGARKIEIWGWKLRAKTDQKSIKKRSPRWMASWHRFFLDFDRFWEASWEGNRSQDRPKKASKNDAKKKSNEIAKKVATRISDDARPPGSWVLGRSTPLSRAKPLRPTLRACADSLFTPFTPSTTRHATTRHATPRLTKTPRRATPRQSDRSWVDF